MGADIESAKTNYEIIHVLHFKECEAHHAMSASTV